MPRVALTLLATLACAAACDGPSSTQVPTGPTSTTQFRISVMNACSDDLIVKLGQSPQDARKQLLFKKMRDTISGTNERVFVMSGDEVVYTYEPIQGEQRATISADCTAMTRE